MEKIKKLHTKQRQFEILVDFMVQHKELAKGHLQTVNAKQVANNLCTRLSDDLNCNGPPVRDIAGWKKVWSDLKNHTKIKMRRNKLSISTTEAINGMPMAKSFGASGDNTSDLSSVLTDVAQENLEPAQNIKFNENLNAAKRPNKN